LLCTWSIIMSFRFSVIWVDCVPKVSLWDLISKQDNCAWSILDVYYLFCGWETRREPEGLISTSKRHVSLLLLVSFNCCSRMISSYEEFDWLRAWQFTTHRLACVCEHFMNFESLSFPCGTCIPGILRIQLVDKILTHTRSFQNSKKYCPTMLYVVKLIPIKVVYTF
jgi:hypothetical protein